MTDTLTLQQFSRLSISEKLGVLESYGVYLDLSRVEDGYKIALFSLFNYYVEVYLKRGSGKFERVTPFTSYRRLDTYLHSIDITDLVQ